MSNKKISEFPLTTSLANSDVFLIDHLGSTSTVSFSTVSQTVSSNIVDNLNNDTVTQKLSTNFIKKPASSTNGQVLTYNGSTSTWVASAAFTGTNGNLLTDNGYTILGNGLILQWGYYNGSGNAALGIDITFPIPFTTSCFMINANYQIGANSVASSITVGIPTKTSGKVFYNGSGYAFYWFAIGI